MSAYFGGSAKLSLGFVTFVLPWSLLRRCCAMVDSTTWVMSKQGGTHTRPLVVLIFGPSLCSLNWNKCTSDCKAEIQGYAQKAGCCLSSKLRTAERGDFAQ